MELVKILIDNDGCKVEEPVWCYVTDWLDCRRTLCSGEAFGIGESEAKFKEKEFGKITCPLCLKIIKQIQRVKI